MPGGPKPCGVVGLLAIWLAGLLFPVRTPAQAPGPQGIKIVVVEGEGAINSIRERRAKEPVIRVVADDSRPAAGAAVTFLVTELGPSATFPTGTTFTTTTDAKGQAVARGLRPNNVAGPFQIRVTASYQGQVASAVINQTNAAAEEVQPGSSKKLAILLIVGGGAVTGAAIAVAGRKKESPGTSAPKPSATTIVPGTGSFGRP